MRSTCRHGSSSPRADACLFGNGCCRSRPRIARRSGDDIRTAEFGWPIGTPLCRAISGHRGLREIRSDLPGGRIARVFFCVSGSSMVLLHGFLKKTQATPAREIETAAKRMRGLR